MPQPLPASDYPSHLKAPMQRIHRHLWGHVAQWWVLDDISNLKGASKEWLEVAEASLLPWHIREVYGDVAVDVKLCGSHTWMRYARELSSFSVPSTIHGNPVTKKRISCGEVLDGARASFRHRGQDFDKEVLEQDRYCNLTVLGSPKVPVAVASQRTIYWEVHIGSNVNGNVLVGFTSNLKPSSEDTNTEYNTQRDECADPRDEDESEEAQRTPGRKWKGRKEEPSSLRQRQRCENNCQTDNPSSTHRGYSSNSRADDWDGGENKDNPKSHWPENQSEDQSISRPLTRAGVLVLHDSCRKVSSPRHSQADDMHSNLLRPLSFAVCANTGELYVEGRQITTTQKGSMDEVKGAAPRAPLVVGVMVQYAKSMGLCRVAFFVQRLQKVKKIVGEEPGDRTAGTDEPPIEETKCEMVVPHLFMPLGNTDGVRFGVEMCLQPGDRGDWVEVLGFREKPPCPTSLHVAALTDSLAAAFHTSA